MIPGYQHLGQTDRVIAGWNGEPYTSFPVNAIVRLSHHRRGDSHNQEMFLAPFADKQTGNYHTGVLIPPSLLINTKVKGIQP